jgi:ubiquinone/menaquinone biosynthesis C-methylase UbiE
MSHEKIVSTFDRWAENGQAERLADAHGDVVRQVIARMGIRPGQQILDLGCGSGWATRLLGSAAPGSGAIGVDVSPAMIARAEATHDLTSRARYECGKFEKLEFKDAKFDRVFSMEALYYAVDLERALAEIARVLKPGGSADIVLDHYEESPHTRHWADKVGLSMHRLSESQWKAAFERAGLVGVVLTRVRDSRGPGEASGFRPSEHSPDWKTRVELHEAGSLWIHAEKAKTA